MKKSVVIRVLAITFLLVPNFDVFAQTAPSSVIEIDFPGDQASQVKDLELFYKNEFGMDVDFKRVKIPGGRKGFDRFIIIPKGLTCNKVYSKLKEKFDCASFFYDDFNKALVHNDREATKKPYAIWIRNRVEADEEWQGKSAIYLEKRRIHGITLIESLVWVLLYYDETHSHLDVKNITLCSGSRGIRGAVPDVSWHPGSRRLEVHWSGPGSTHPNLGTREVVY